ncbi:2536_t:CDS:2 [Racocetra fulgida]|uniref:2536_t:CDS:1 n=1 Tax=Racocetra fulgida TaxID=60492 RepID=A0A9N8WLM6_9GLOM|nr:2536_t:CDS:2 [Racocetra fulgida]
MVLNKKKGASAISRSPNASDREEVTRSISESETDRSEQSSDSEDEPFSKTNKMSTLIKRLETLEKLQTAHNKTIDHNQPLEVTRTSSPVNNARITTDTSTSRAPLTTLQQQNNSDIPDISSTTEVSKIPSKKSRASGRTLRSHASRYTNIL